MQLEFEAYDPKLDVIDTKLAVEVQILDINDNVPTFIHSHYMVHLKESAPQGKFCIVCNDGIHGNI